MKKCLLCGKETAGSVGAAGIHWSSICQECKDKEDRGLEASMKVMGKVLDAILPVFPVSPTDIIAATPKHNDDMRRLIGEQTKEIDRLSGENASLKEELERASR